jgi:hypothetical protein
MSAAAEALLNDQTVALRDPERRAYVLTAGMLGLMRMERPDDALSLWRSHGEESLAASGIPSYTRLVLQLVSHADT